MSLTFVAPVVGGLLTMAITHYNSSNMLLHNMTSLLLVIVSSKLLLLVLLLLPNNNNKVEGFSSSAAPAPTTTTAPQRWIQQWQRQQCRQKQQLHHRHHLHHHIAFVVCYQSSMGGEDGDDLASPATTLENMASIFRNDLKDLKAANAINDIAIVWRRAVSDVEDGVIDGDVCDWLDLTQAISNAVPAFSSSNVESYGRVGEELLDMSSIEGCMSIGPPSSIPNWISIQEEFKSLANEKESDAFQQIANELDALIEML